MGSTFHSFPPYGGESRNPSSPSALLLPPVSPTSPTILLSQACEEGATSPGQAVNSEQQSEERTTRKISCFNKQVFTCLVIFLPIAIPSIVYLKEVNPLKRIIEPAFVIFIAVLFTFSVVFIIRILGEASVAYWGSPVGAQDQSSNNRGSARSSPRPAGQNFQRRFFGEDQNLLGQMATTAGPNQQYYYHHHYAQQADSQRLTVHYHLPPGNTQSLSATNSPNVSFRYGRPSCRRGIRRARTPSPLYLHRGVHNSIHVSPLRVRSSPSSPLYSRLPNHYHFLTNITTINAVATKLDDPPPPYDKALKCPLAPVSPSASSNKFFGDEVHSRSADDVAINICDEAPPPSYDANTMKL